MDFRELVGKGASTAPGKKLDLFTQAQVALDQPPQAHPVRPSSSKAYSLEKEQMVISCTQLLLNRKERGRCRALHVRFLLLGITG